jgi:uncharacterized protein (TIGR00255 family)
MIKSMTGFASLTHDDDVATVDVSIKTVNHRFLDLQLRLPPLAAEAEPRVRAAVQRRLTRGRVEVQVGVQLRRRAVPHVELNEAFTRSLGEAVARARALGLVQGELSPGDLLRFPQAIEVREAGSDDASTEGLVSSIEAAVDQALADLDAMRVREGGHLQTDLDARRVQVGALVEAIARAADDGRAAVEARVHTRVRELQLDAAVEPAVLAQEIVRLAQRSDIAEEVTRFRAHLEHWEALTVSPEACGRKLDFLLQEMNREVNTMGSKADGAKASELVIGTKAELERMREQVQNVE